MDFYEILGVSKTATAEEIKKAYREKAMKYHPDRNPGDKDAVEKFKQVQTAYDTLSDDNKRADYNLGKSSPHTAKANPFHAGWPFNDTADRGRNLQIIIELTLEEVLTGVVRKQEIDRKGPCSKCDSQGYTEFVPCKKCSGSGKMPIKKMPFNAWTKCDQCRGTGRAGTVACKDCSGSGFETVGKEMINMTIPKGLSTGMQVRVFGKGEPSRTGGRPGDLVFVIMVKEHVYFKRVEGDLHVEVPLCYSEFIAGTQITFKDLRGREVQVVVPKNTKPDTQLRVKRKGMPSFPDGRLGDIIVTLKCFMPTSVNKEHEELLQRLMKIELPLLDISNFGRLP